MPFNSATAVFSRVWRFVDRFLPGQDITRADLDLMADDLTEGINAALRNNLNFVGDWIAGSAFPTTRPNGAPIRARDTWRVSTGGTVGGVTFVVDDYLTALVPTPGTLYANNWLKIPALLIPSVLTLVDQAELARDEAQAALDSFDDRYLGAKAVAPTLDNDGNALIDGALYWDTAVKRFRVYDLGTTSWVDTFLPAGAYLQVAQLLNDLPDKPTARFNLGLAIGSNVQAFSSLLTTIAGLSSNGFLAKTGATTAAARTITAGAGIAVSNGDGVSGDPTIGFNRGAPVTKTADFTVAATENWLINNKSGSACVVTLPAASSFTGREIMIQNLQMQAVNSASSNVVPQLGGSAAAAILPAIIGAWAKLVSNGANWQIVQSGLNFIAPGSAPVYACRAWVNFDASSTPTIRASGNVSSVSFNTTGDFTVNFAVPMPDANYATVFGGSLSDSFTVTGRYATTAPTTSSVRIGTFNAAGAPQNPTWVSVAIFR